MNLLLRNFLFAKNTNLLLLFFLSAFTVSAQWDSPAPVEVFSQASQGFIDCDLNTVNNRPAIAFYDFNNFEVKYMRANDATGNTWGTPLTVDNNFRSGNHSIDLEIINGHPAVVSDSPVGKDVRYTRAADADGTSWNSTVLAAVNIASSYGADLFLDLETVNGRPAVAYYDGDNQDLYYVRANDANGDTWGTPVLVAFIGNVGQYLSMEIVNGRPAISYYDASNQDLMFVRANNADGTSWGTPQTIASAGDAGKHAVLEIVGGHPTVAYRSDYLNVKSLMYQRANDADGSSWGTAIPVSNQDLKHNTLKEINGKVGIACKIVSSDKLVYFESVDNGNTWSGADYPDLNNTNNHGNDASLAFIGGNPAIVYRDLTDTKLFYTRRSSCINITCYADTDNDTYGDPNNSSIFCVGCGTGYVTNNTDCNDSNSSVNPGASLSLNCPADITVNNDPGFCTAVVTYTMPTAAGDNCTTPAITQTQGIMSGGVFPVGTTTNIYTLTAGAATDQCSFTVTVNDTEPPVFTSCPSDITQNAAAGECNAVVNFTQPVASDNCALGMQGTLATPLDSNNGQRGVMFDVTATNALSIQKFDANLYLSSTGRYEIYYKVGTHVGFENNASAWTFVGGADNVTSLGSNIVTPLPIPVNVSIPAGATYAFYITNDTGAGINYTDGTAVGNLWASNSDLIVYEGVGKSYPFALTFDVRKFNGIIYYNSNNISGVSQTQGDPSGSSFAVGTNQITFRATDGAGNTTDCSFDITVNDSEAPVAVCQDITIQLNGTGNATASAAAVDNGSSDNCNIASSVLSKTAFTCADIGANSVTLTVTDDGGSSDLCNANINVEDPLSACCAAPTALCQNTINVNLNTVGAVNITAGQIDNGSSVNCGTPVLSLSQSSFTCADLGNNSLTLTVTDSNNQTDNCSATVIVSDINSPTAQCQAVTLSLDAAGNASLTTAQVDNNSTDNCSLSFSLSKTAFTCSDIGTQNVTFTATDPASNSDNCSAVITVQDNIAPSALCQDINLPLNAAGAASITTANIDNGSNDNCAVSNLSLSKTTFGCADVGANSVTLTVSDASGNTATCNATVTVQDNIKPTALCQDFTLQLNTGGTGTLSTNNIDNSSSDACGIASRSLSQTSFTCSDVGANSVTLTVTDNNGNSETCSATVTVADSELPMAICQDLTIQLDAGGSASITASDIDNGSMDNCGLASLSLSQTNFTCNEVGGNSVTLTGIDVNGNSATCNATLTVEDPLLTCCSAPTALCQNTFSVNLNAAGTASISPADIDNGSMVDCGTPGLTLSQMNFTCADLGSTSITLTVSDANNQTDNCTSTLNVSDNIAPTAQCQNITIQLDVNNAASITAADVDNNSTDACGLATSNISFSSFTCDNLGANNVILTVTDLNGNTDNCTALVTVKDDINPCCAAPLALCQNFTASLDAAGNASISTADVDAGSTYECGLQSIVLSQMDFTCADLNSTQNVTLTVSDINNDTDNCTATITIVDNTPPLALCRDITVTLDAAGNASITSADIDNASNDNCSFITLSLSETDFDCTDIGANSVTLTVTDGSANSASCNANVSVEDNSAPVVQAQNITAYLDDTGNLSVTPADVDMASYDNCGVASMSLTYAGTTGAATAFDCTSVGSQTLTLTVTDNNGNSASQSATITVVDAIPAEIQCRQPVVTTASEDNCMAMGLNVLPPLVLYDNCGIESGINISRTPAGNDFPIGTTVLNWTVTDGNGNPATCQSEVIVEDAQAPEINLPTGNTIVTYVNAQSCEATVYLNATGTDNCGAVNLSGNGNFTYGIGIHTHTLTATDIYGNSVTEEVTIYVHDTYAPVAMDCPETLEVISNDNLTEVTLPEVNFTDNCGIISISSDAPEVFSHGSTEVNITAEDIYGLETTCTFTVNVTPTIFLTSALDDIEAATQTETSLVNWNEPLARSTCEVCDLPEDSNFVHLGDYRGHQYFLYTNPLNWEDAGLLAESMDAQLLTLNNETEQNFLFTEIFDRPELQQVQETAWTGYYNEGEQWQWMSGEEAALSLPEIPDLDIAQNYAASLGLNGEWTVEELDALRPVILERTCLTINQVAPVFNYEDEEGNTVSDLLTCGEEWELGNYEVIYEITDACGDARLVSFDVNIDEDAEYCTVTGENSEVWLQTVLLNQTMLGNEDLTGYHDFTEQQIPVPAGQTLNLSMNPAGSLSSDDLSPLFRRVWIDLDDDGDFFGADEMVFETTMPGSIGTQLSNIPVPNDSTLNIRVIASQYALPEVCAPYLQGEAEDYVLSFYTEETGTEEVDLSFTLAPNPADNYTLLKFAQFADTDIEITLRDLLGNIVQSKTINNSYIKQHALRFDHLQDGIYFLEIRDEAGHTEISPLTINRLTQIGSSN